MRQSVLDKTLRQVDTRQRRAESNLLAKEQVLEHKDQRVVRARQLQNRRALVQAQQEARDTEDRERVRFLLKTQSDRDTEKVEETRKRISSQRAFEQYLRESREELAAREAEAAAGEDLETYERTLASFRTLAEGVQEHGSRMRSAIQGLVEGGSKESAGLAEDEEEIRPFTPAEQRVRAELSILEEDGGDGRAVEEVIYDSRAEAVQRARSSSPMSASVVHAQQEDTPLLTMNPLISMNQQLVSLETVLQGPGGVQGSSLASLRLGRRGEMPLPRSRGGTVR